MEKEIKALKQNKALEPIQVEVLNHEPAKNYFDTTLQDINKALERFTRQTEIELQEKDLQKLINRALEPADLLNLKPYNSLPTILKQSALERLKSALEPLQKEVSKLYYNVRPTNYLQYAELVSIDKGKLIASPKADEQIKSLFEVYITDENKLKSYYKALEIAKQLQELEKELNLSFDRIFNYDLFAQSYEINKHEFLNF
ncbi:hypothetical protein ACTS93_18170 [Empedobacter falsenii]